MVSVYEILYNYGIEADTYFTETNSKGLINYFNDKLRHPPQISSQLTGFYDNLLSASLSGEYIKKLPLTFLDWMENFNLAVKSRVDIKSLPIYGFTGLLLSRSCTEFHRQRP